MLKICRWLTHLTGMNSDVVVVVVLIKDPPKVKKLSMGKKRAIKGNASIRCRSRSHFLGAYFGSGFLPDRVRTTAVDEYSRQLQINFDPGLLTRWKFFICTWFSYFRFIRGVCKHGSFLQ